MPITQVPAYTKVPNRSSAPATFSDDTDTFLSEIAARVTAGNTQANELNTLAGEVETNSTAAVAAKTDAEAALAAFLSSQDATKWVSGAAYTEGDPVWSPVNLLTYRARTTHSGLTTDPSADGVNWAPIGGDLVEAATEARYFAISITG